MKATLITGASGGIGEAFARALARAKRNLVLAARSEDRLHQLCDELMLEHKITAHYVALDLTAPDADRKLFEETERHGFEIDFLVNNAGFGSMGDFAELELERELEMIRLNVVSLVALTHRYLGKMRTRGAGGVILNVSSTASFQPVPFMATYAATKAFVTSFSEALAEENARFGITVAALCPGPTATNFFNASAVEPFQAKGMQTADEVVETALAGVRGGRRQIISGWTNFLGARLGNFVPNSIITKVIAGVLRPKVEKNLQQKS